MERQYTSLWKIHRKKILKTYLWAVLFLLGMFFSLYPTWSEETMTVIPPEERGPITLNILENGTGRDRSARILCDKNNDFVTLGNDYIMGSEDVLLSKYNASYSLLSQASWGNKFMDIYDSKGDFKNEFLDRLKDFNEFRDRIYKKDGDTFDWMEDKIKSCLIRFNYDSNVVRISAIKSFLNNMDFSAYAQNFINNLKGVDVVENYEGYHLDYFKILESENRILTPRRIP